MSPLAARFSSLSLVWSASNLKPRARRATACCSYLVHLYPHDQLPRECLSESRAEFLAIAAVVETGIRALRRVNQPCVPAIGAILLASNLSHRLARWAHFVDHSVLGLAPSHLCPNHDDLFLRYSNRLVTPGTEITAQSETSTDKSLECLGLRRHLRKNLSRSRFVSGHSNSDSDHGALLFSVW